MNVDPQDIFRYLLSNGMSPAHAAGVVANISGESSFNASAVGDSGTSFGLAQWHNERGEAMKRAVGEDWRNDWRGQLDFLLSESDTKKYLGTSFTDPFQASDWFTRHWERPKDPNAASAKRQNFLRTFISEAGATGTTPPAMPGAIMNPQILQQLLLGNPVDLSAQPEPSLGQSLAGNPMLQMGLGILGASGGSGLQNIAQGAQMGLLNATKAEQNLEQMHSKRLQQALWQKQIQNSIANTLGGGQMSPYEQSTQQYRNEEQRRKREELELEWAKHEEDKLSRIEGGKKEAASDEEVQRGLKIGTRLIDLLEENPYVVGGLTTGLSEKAGYAKQAGEVLDMLGVPGGRFTRGIGETLMPGDKQEKVNEYQALAGMYLGKLRKAVSADKGSVMSEPDQRRLNQLTKVLESAATAKGAITAIRTIESVFKKEGYTLDSYAETVGAMSLPGEVGRNTLPTTAPPTDEEIDNMTREELEDYLNQ